MCDVSKKKKKRVLGTGSRMSLGLFYLGIRGIGHNARLDASSILADALHGSLTDLDRQEIAVREREEVRIRFASRAQKVFRNSEPGEKLLQEKKEKSG